MMAAGSSPLEQNLDHFQNVRKQLTDLNYRETFGVESLDLVHRLLQDLLSTTQSYKQIQDRESRLAQDLSLVQSQLFPLRKENARLARENHDLHVDNIKLNEDIRVEMEQFSKRIRMLNDEIAELKMLNKVSEEQLRAKDFLVDELRDAYESVADPALKSRNLTASSIKISTHLPPSDAGTANIDPRTAWERLKEQINTPNEKNETLAAFNVVQSQLEEANFKVQIISEENAKLKSSLSVREQELSRAGRLIGDAGQPPNTDGSGSGGGLSSNYYDTMANSAQVMEAANKRIIDQLNGQVDFLNDQLAQREAQIAIMGRKWAAIEQLENDLSIRTGIMENLKDENSRLAERVRGLERKILAMAASSVGSTSVVGSPNVPRSAHFDAPVDEQKTVRDSFDQESRAELAQKLEAERAKVAARDALVEQLVADKKALEAETKDLALKVNVAQSSSTPSKPAAKAFASKHSSGLISATITKRTPASVAKSTPAVPSPVAKDRELIRDLNAEVEDLRKQNRVLSRRVEELHAASLRPAVASQPVDADAHTVAKLQQDNLFLKTHLDAKETLAVTLGRDYDNVSALQKQTLSDLQDTRTQLLRAEDTLRVLDREHRELRDKYETLLQLSATAQSEHAHVQGEDQAHREDAHQLRIQVEDQTQELRRCGEEIDRLRTQLQRHDPTCSPRQQASAEHKNADTNVPSLSSSESYKERISDLTAELNLYKERHQSLQEDYADLMHTAEAYQQAQAALQQQQTMLASDFNSLREAHAVLQNQHMSMELSKSDMQHVCAMESRKRTTLEEEVRRMRAENSTHQQTITQLKDLVQTMTQNMSIEQNRSKLLERTIQQMEEMHAYSDTDKQKCKDTIHALQDEVGKYKQILYALDQEKDDLCDKLDVAEEKAQQYEQQLRALQAKVSAFEEEVLGYQRREEKYKKEVTAKINALGLLEAKCNSVESQYSAAREALQQRSVTLNHHSEDLMLMTKENQVLNNTLINLNNELTHLRQGGQDQAKRIRVLEEEKKIAEIENGDLLAHYKALVQEKQRLEEDMKMVATQQRDGQNNAYSLSRQLQESQDLLRSQSHALQSHAQDRAALQTQVLQLNEHVVQLQRRVEAVDSDNRKMIQETHGLKQTNAMLNERLTIVMKRATSCQENGKVLTARLGSVERERDGLRAVLEVERQRSADMSKLAETARIEAATKEIHIQRLQSEVMTLSAAQHATGSPVPQGSAGTPPAST